MLPSDFTRSVEPAGWAWLLKYGLPMSYWKPYTGYSQEAGRLVFTCEGFSIGRLVEEGKPGRKWYVWGDCHKSAEIIGNNTEISVLVEDIVSAHKVGQLYETIPLFGTEIHRAHIYALRTGSAAPIVLWLDKDQEGYTQKKALRLQMLTNRPVFVLHTPKDPKELTNDEIFEACSNTVGLSNVL